MLEKKKDKRFRNKYTVSFVEIPLVFSVYWEPKKFKTLRIAGSYIRGYKL